MNYDIILSKLREAREELDKLISMIISTDKPDEVEFEFFFDAHMSSPQLLLEYQELRNRKTQEFIRE